MPRLPQAGLKKASGSLAREALEREQARHARELARQERVERVRQRELKEQRELHELREYGGRPIRTLLGSGRSGSLYRSLTPTKHREGSSLGDPKKPRKDRF